MLISPAYAQTAGGGESGLVSLLPLVLIFVVFYFLLIRPQQKKMKAHKAMVEALKRGDKIVTSGGLIGTVSKVISDSEVQVEIAEGVRVKVMRPMVQEILSKPEPGEKAKAAGEGEKGAANDDKGETGAKGGFGLSSLLGGKGKSGG